MVVRSDLHFGSHVAVIQPRFFEWPTTITDFDPPLIRKQLLGDAAGCLDGPQIKIEESGCVLRRARHYLDHHHFQVQLVTVKLVPSFIRLVPEEFGFHLDQRKWVTYLTEPSHKVTTIEDFHILDDDITSRQLDRIFIPGSFELGFRLTFQTPIGSLVSQDYKHK